MNSSISFSLPKWLTIKKTTIIEIISAAFILLFIYTAFSKLGSYNGFVSVLSRSPLIGTKANLIGWLIPAIEIVVALLLIFPRTKQLGLNSSLALMILFTAYLTYMIYFAGGELPCACGGVLNTLTWKQHLIFNIVFTLLGLAGALLARNRTRSMAS